MSQRKNHIPIRRCVGCGIRRPKREMLRIVANENGLEVDADQRKSTRGAYVCPTSRCIKKAIKSNAISNALKKQGFFSKRIEHLEKVLNEQACL